jgi:membrane protease subunit HflC
MRRVIIGIFTAVVLLVLFVVLCTFVKRPYERVLLVRFGTPIEDAAQARLCYNWFLKLPTDNVVRFDNRLHLYTGPLQEVVTAGKEPISIRTFAAWRIVNPMLFYKQTGGSDEKAQGIIEQILLGLVQGKIVNHQLDELFNADETKIHTDQIEGEIATEATNGTPGTPTTPARPGLRDMGIQMAEIGFSRMAFPPSNAPNVYERMVAELNKRATDYQTQGIANANIIRAEGRQKAEAERADGIRLGQQIRGEGDAEANRILASVQLTAQAREFYQYWKSLDFLKTSLAKNTILVLSSASDLLGPVFHLPQNSLPPATAPAAPARALQVIPGATVIPATPPTTRPGN